MASASALALAVAVGFAVYERGQRRASAEAIGLSQLVASVLADEQMRSRLGEIELQGVRLQEGIAACRAFLAEHDVAEARALLGRLLRMHRRGEEARTELDRALAMKPDLVEAKLERGLLAASRLGSEMARLSPPAALDEAGRMSEDQRALRETALADLAAVAERPERVRALDALSARAALLRLQGDRKKARATYEEVLRLELASTDAYLGLSELDLVEGDATSAMKNAMSGVDIHRGLAPAYQARTGGVEPPEDARALTLAPVEGVEGALADLRPALRASPSDATGHANRGLVLARRAAQLALEGWPAQAVEVWGSAADACRAALLLDGELIQARNNLGVALGERARILGTQGRVVEAARDRAQAIAELDRVVLSDPASPFGWLNRGVVRRRANREGSEGEGDLARALELASDARMRSVVDAVINPSAR